MGKYVKVHPTVDVKKEAIADFKDDDDEIWSYVIKDKYSSPVFLGDFEKFDFEEFSIQIGRACRMFTWAQARELGETIIELADKHEKKE